MSFDYLICLDVEATCWGIPNRRRNRRQNQRQNEAEIMEIGAVLLNLKNGAIEAEFHRYVRPTMNPILSDYCVNLTGISQSLIDQQSPFPLVYYAFFDWLCQIGKEKQLHYATAINPFANAQCNAIFCTWTNWDLDHYIRIDCERNNMRQPIMFEAWIDARKMFKKVYALNTNFADALKILNVRQVGRAHSAIDDAKSLAKMVKNLSDRGVVFDRLTNYRYQGQFYG